MAIEIITPDLVSINGFFVELRDSRKPDYFDVQCDKWNREIQAEYAAPIEDIDLNFDTVFCPYLDQIQKL